jgi:hypothetical protein
MLTIPRTFLGVGAGLKDASQAGMTLHGPVLLVVQHATEVCERRHVDGACDGVRWVRGRRGTLSDWTRRKTARRAKAPMHRLVRSAKLGVQDEVLKSFLFWGALRVGVAEPIETSGAEEAPWNGTVFVVSDSLTGKK